MICDILHQVEGGRIDHAHHDTMAHRALDELVAMDDAVQQAAAMTSEEVSGVACRIMQHESILIFTYN